MEGEEASLVVSAPLLEVATKLCIKPGDTDGSKDGSSETKDGSEESRLGVGSGDPDGVVTLGEGDDTDGEGAGGSSNKGVTSNVSVTAPGGVVNWGDTS